MYLTFTILKAILLLGGIVYFVKGMLKFMKENKPWPAIKAIGVVFLIVLIITLLDFIIPKAK
jgi:hypothetical protein